MTEFYGCLVAGAGNVVVVPIWQNISVWNGWEDERKTGMDRWPLCKSYFRNFL